MTTHNIPNDNCNHAAQQTYIVFHLLTFIQHHWYVHEIVYVSSLIDQVNVLYAHNVINVLLSLTVIHLACFPMCKDVFNFKLVDKQYNVENNTCDFVSTRMVIEIVQQLLSPIWWQWIDLKIPKTFMVIDIWNVCAVGHAYWPIHICSNIQFTIPYHS